MSFEDIANRMAARDRIDPAVLILGAPEREHAGTGRISIVMLIAGLIVVGAGVAMIVVTLSQSSEVSYLGSFLVAAGTSITTSAFAPAASKFGESLGRSSGERQREK